MKITKEKLVKAEREGIITSRQVEDLYTFFNREFENTPQFTFTHVLYYLGGLVAIGAMTLFMTLGWETYGGAGIVVISAIYAFVGLLLTNTFSARRLVIPAGICGTFVVCITPLAIYGLQQWLGVWPDESVYQDYHRQVKWHWLYMELGTLAAGVILAWRLQYPFMVMPIAVTLWYMTMDIAVIITGDDYSWELRKIVSMYSGLLMLGLAFWIDIRSRHNADYAFWVYLFGVIAFWGGLSLQNSSSEWSKFFYCCTNLVMIGVGALLLRRVFVIFGAIGICLYLSHLASDVFKNSWGFPISLTLIGLGVIYLGIVWQKHEKAITDKCRVFLPTPLRELLESRL